MKRRAVAATSARSGTPGDEREPSTLLPTPGNAELLVLLAVEILFAVVWAASDAVDADDFVSATAIVTATYLLSRGIAKASRVSER